jgi:alanine racemase
MMFTHSTIHIDLAALAHNYAVISHLAPQSNILAMVKANAYGHGLVEVARALPQVEGFGVACLSEACALRKAGITQKIVLMRGIYDQVELDIVNDEQIDIVVHSPFQLSLLSNQTHWIKINTGMNRLGFLPEEFERIIPALKDKKVIVMTHFAEAEKISNVTQSQIDRFEEMLKKTGNVTYKTSLANSAGILNWKNAHADWIRPGLMLYGVLPMPAPHVTLAPVMTWEATLLAVRMQKKGDAIGYNGDYICEETMPVGIVGAGYADGYPRHAKNGTPVLVNGIVCPLVGRVSMDMLAVDLRNMPSAKINDPVILWGKGLPIEKVAAFADSNTRELLCHVRLRVK